MVEHCVRSVVAVSDANGLAVHVREVEKVCTVVAKWARRARKPDGYAATLSRHGEADSVTNPPTRWDERQGQKGVEVADLLVPHWAVDAGLR
jgi:hypothetical protein